MQKNETGLFSTIKKFIRGNAVKVGTAFFFWFYVLHSNSTPQEHTHLLKKTNQKADKVKLCLTCNC